jgi:uncharacterized tellurite resistance protein B-like protein
MQPIGGTTQRKIKNRRRARAISILARFAPALAVVLFITAHAFARAGGGEGFGGGGGGYGGGGGGGYGGGGHGGGGGGGIFWIVYLWFNFCIDYPWLGLPITAAVIFFFYKSHQVGWSTYQDSVIRRGSDAGDDNRASEATAAAVAADGTFDVNEFSSRINTAFMKIQQAWCAQNLSTVWPFISDGVHERFSLQLDEQKFLGYQDQMENISVDAVTLVEYAPGDVFDIATVRIDARAADFRISLKDHTRIAGSKIVEPFVEMWSWMRRHGMTRDPSKPGLIEGNCPNCGAPIEMNEAGQCQSCKALLRSGEFDWVLTEITQESEWRRGRHDLAAGTIPMRSRDPGFNRVELEDKATVIFWRKAAADRIGKIDPLRKMASDDFCGKYAPTFAPQPDGTRAFFGDCAIGGAHLVGVEPGSVDDIAVLEIAWEGERMLIPPGAPAHPTGDRIHTHTIYLLKRKVGVLTDPGKGVSSAHCPKCGAPIISDTSPGCTYCGAVLNDGSNGWVLTGILSAASDEGRQWVARLSSPTVATGAAAQNLNNPSNRGVLAWTVKMVAADGAVDAGEREILRSLAARLGLEQIRVDHMIDVALAGNLDVPDPPDPATAKSWLTTMATAAMAQGRLRPQEAKILSRAAQRFGYSDEDVNLLLRQQYNAQFTRAKAELQQQRQRS